MLEPQPPTAWADGSITVTANLGALSGDTAYLFVYDADGAVNDPGFVVTIAGELPDAGADAAADDDAGVGGSGGAGAGGPDGGGLSADGGSSEEGCGCRLAAPRRASEVGWVVLAALLAAVRCGRRPRGCDPPGRGRSCGQTRG